MRPLDLVRRGGSFVGICRVFFLRREAVPGTRELAVESGGEESEPTLRKRASSDHSSHTGGIAQHPENESRSRFRRRTH